MPRVLGIAAKVYASSPSSVSILDMSSLYGRVLHLSQSHFLGRARW